MEKIKVLHVVHNFLRGGIESFLYYLSKEQMQNPNLDIQILCCSKKENVVNKRIQGLGVPIHYIEIRPFEVNFFRYAKIYNLVNNFHLVHLHVFFPLLGFVLNFSKAKVVFTVHSSGSIRRDRTLKIRMKDFALKLFLNHVADGIANNSKYTKDFWLTQGVSDRLENKVIYNGVFFSAPDSVKKIYDENPFLIGKKLIGTTCRLIPWKRVDALILAFTMIKKRLPENWDLIIIGDGPEKEKLKILAERESIISRVHFMGYKSNITDWQSILDVCVFPSAEEPFGLVAIECMHLGKPVYVLKDGGGLVEIVERLSNKYVADDINDLANKLYQESSAAIIHETEKIIEYSNSFSVKKTEQEYFNLYNLIINGMQK